jgi:hypothetical protein
VVEQTSLKGCVGGSNPSGGAKNMCKLELLKQFKEISTTKKLPTSLKEMKYKDLQELSEWITDVIITYRNHEVDEIEALFESEDACRGGA